MSQITIAGSNEPTSFESLKKLRRFHDAGYRGLYGGLGNDGIKRRKAIPADENLMDRMDTTELAANQFRMTQARDKLARQRVKGQQKAIATHEQVGKEVREAIKRIGGIMPENIPPAEHIKQVEKRLKSARPKLELEARDAAGLIGDTEETTHDYRRTHPCSHA